MRRSLLPLVLLPLFACGGSGGSPVQPTPTPTMEPGPTPTPQGPFVLRHTTFKGANGYNTKGTADIVQDGTQYSLELRSDFEAPDAGVLELRLCHEPNCTTPYRMIERLRAFRGAQSYALSDDGGAYGYVIVWCLAADIPFGVGLLS